MVCHEGTRSCFTKAIDLPTTVAERNGESVRTMKIRLGIPKAVCRRQPSNFSVVPACPVLRTARSYFASTGDPEIECMLIRAQEMARYVEHGALDAGLTGP